MKLFLAEYMVDVDVDVMLPNQRHVDRADWSVVLRPFLDYEILCS